MTIGQKCMHVQKRDFFEPASVLPKICFAQFEFNHNSPKIVISQIHTYMTVFISYHQSGNYLDWQNNSNCRVLPIHLGHLLVSPPPAGNSIRSFMASSRWKRSNKSQSLPQRPTNCVPEGGTDFGFYRKFPLHLLTTTS